MKVTEEHVFGRRDSDNGFQSERYDIRVEASELGIPPGPPPRSVSVELPSGEVMEFGLVGQQLDRYNRLIHWSYWNATSSAPPINLQIFND